MSISNFYPVTPEVARKLRSAKLTAAEWRIWSYLIEIDPWGDVYKDIDTLTVMTECDVSKATYYRAIAKFQELELFDIQDKGISIRNLAGVSSLKNETAVSEMRQDSQNCETRRKNETKKSKMRRDSQNCEKQSPEPLPNKPSEAPHTIHTYSDFLQTLSDQERESFKKFCDRKVKESDFKIEIPSAWLNRHYLEYWEEFKQRYSNLVESSQLFKPKRPTLKYLKNFYKDGWKNAAIHNGYSLADIELFENQGEFQ